MFEKPTRNHITFIVERLGVFFFFLMAFGLNSLSQNAGELFTAAYWRRLFDSASAADGRYFALGTAALLLLAVIVLVFATVAWLKTTFRIEGRDLVCEKRTLFKKQSRLPADHIATVNIERSVFERLVGTSKVKIDLNSSHTANRTDFIFYLNAQTAERFRDALIQLKNAGYESAGAQPLPEATREKVVFFTLGQVVRHRLLSVTIIQALVVLSVIAAPLTDGGTYGSQNIKAVAALSLVSGLGVLAWSIVNLKDYTVSRSGPDILITCGAARKRSFSFSSDRMKAVFIKRTLLARLFGLYSIETAVVGLGNEKSETPQICLLADKAQARRVLGQCAPGFECGEPPLRAQKPALAVTGFRSLAAATVCTLLPLVRAGTWFWWLFPASAAVFFTAGALRLCAKTLRFDTHVLNYSKGVLDKTIGMFRFGDIQDIRIFTNPFLRRFGTGRMSFTILSGSKMKHHRTGYFKLEDLEKIADLAVGSPDNMTLTLKKGKSS